MKIQKNYKTIKLKIENNKTENLEKKNKKVNK